MLKMIKKGSTSYNWIRDMTAVSKSALGKLKKDQDKHWQRLLV